MSSISNDLTNSNNLNDLMTAYQQNPQSVLNGDYNPNGLIPVATISNDLLSSYNAMVTAQTNDSICDASCQYDASVNALYKAMENARLNEIQAPYEYEQAEEAYYAFIGESKQFEEEQYNILKEEYEITFDELIHNDRQLNDNYNTMYINTNNSYDLYLDLLSKNEKLRKQLNITASNIFTNDRKSVYENQGLKTIQLHGKILFIFHILFVIFFIFAIFYFKTTLSIYRKIFFIILVILQPMIGRLIMFILNKLYDSVKLILPKNVYLSL